MKTVLLAVGLVVSLCGGAIATESGHSVVVDTPEFITLTHATPDTWHALPPVKNVPEATGRLIYAACDPGPPLVFAQVGRL
jgi:hypothetical protein